MTHSNDSNSINSRTPTFAFSTPSSVTNFIKLCTIPLIGWLVINFFLRLLNNPFLFCGLWTIVTLTGVTADYFNIQLRSYQSQSPCQKYCACNKSHSESSAQGEMQSDKDLLVPDVGTQTPQAEKSEKPAVKTSADEDSWIIVPENEKAQENLQNCIKSHQSYKDDPAKKKQAGKKEDIRIDCAASEEKPSSN